MASSLINNVIQVYFDSVLGMEHEGMVATFEALLLSRLSGFLGCSSAIYEASLVKFFHNASVRDGKVVSIVQGKLVAISEELFAGTFELPLEGLTDLHEVPKDLVFEARSVFSYDGKQLSTSCKKREMTSEFRLLNDILAKSMTVKAGSFDAVTHERFLMMSTIHGGVQVKWGRLLFNIFKDMVTPNSKQARGYAVQICILLKNSPDLELGESKEFPPLKILTANGTYIAKNKNIFVDVDEPTEEDNNERAAPEAKSLALVTVAQEAVPIQMVSAVTPPAPKRKAPKRNFKLPVGSDDEIVEKEPDVENVVEQQRDKTYSDDVDKIIDQVITETAQMQTDMEEPSLTRYDDIVVEDTERSIAVSDEDDNIDGAENEIARKMVSFTAPKQFIKEPLISGEDDDMSGLKKPSKIIEMEKENESEKDKEIELVDLSLAKSVATMTDSEDTEPLSKQIPVDMMLPSAIAAEITRIKFGRGIEIPGVSEGDWYKVNLPQIAISDKGSLRRLPVLDSIKDIIAKEEHILAWAETDSLETSVRRREYIIAKYREMLLRKFLEAHRKNFRSGHPTTAIDLQIIVLLFDAHLFALETLQTQMSIQGLKWERMCSSSLFEGEIRDRETAVDQILMPTADVTPQDFTKPLAQLRASVNQSQIERVQKMDDDRTYRGLFANVRQDVQLQKAALSLEILESRRKLQSQQENCNTLTSHLSELVDYINRGGDAKKGEGSSIRGPQHPPDDRSRPGSGDSSRSRGSRSEPLGNEVVVVLIEETGDIGLEGADYWIDLDNCFC
ncbi:splicing factor 3B subunit 1-like [Dorcoceras hygrometricum]|uniref:Splicing factor 3B subunit 1-like n=1 Tax=Dorcoceras hygrometricum TaxID=472368 RepID=A0A2Z7AXL7_9LAMI|nr:splicing factor 3B subunit 1-like [Dorcoceras hygrometricum]